jgi:bifunctional non-homologous end joining protein LigD
MPFGCTTTYGVIYALDGALCRWGNSLTAEDMEKCVWVRPELVAQIEFLEWTESDHLRHSKFAGLRQDKDARTMIKEQIG